MKDLNCVIIEGNLTRDCEVKQFTNSKKLSFSVAVNLSYNQAVFLNVIKWGDVEKYADLKKGQRVRVVGYLLSEKWEKDGEKMEFLKINADCIQVFERKERQEPTVNTAFDSNQSSFGNFKEDILF